jgi:cellobiose PTS system EIIC component
MSMLEKVLRLSDRIYEHRWITAIRKGLLLTFPFIIIGSFSILLQNLPIKHYQNFMNSMFGGAWLEVLGYIKIVTFDMLALFLVLTVSYSIASAHSTAKDGKLNSIIVAIVSLISFLMLTISKKGLLDSDSAATGMILAIVTAIISTELFIRLYKRKHLRFKNIKLDEDPVISQVLLSIIPAIIVFAVFVCIYLSVRFFGFSSVNDLFNRCISKIFSDISNPLTFVLVLNFLNQIFWFFGIHGNHILNVASKTFFDNAANMNAHAIAAGHVPTQIFTKTFFDVFVIIGGSGATLCLLIAIFVKAKRNSTRQLAKISLFPAIFNINEIVILGLPIVLNPMFLIPFVLGPIILTLVSYYATKFGLVPITTTEVDWTTPPLLNAYMATDSWRALALQLFNICLGVMIYLPFVKFNEDKKEKEIQQTFKKLMEIAESTDFSTSQNLLKRNDKIGNLARILSNDINEAIIKDGFTLEYQPQIDSNNNILGVEALLRWTHNKFGRIPPMLTVAIAEEAGLMNDLGKWVLSKACCQLGEWNENGIKGLRMSINVSPTQLHDTTLPEAFVQLIKKYKLDPKDIELEITEGIAMDVSEATMDIISTMKNLGVNLAMDDFGMGYTSLLYIRYFSINTIKIDGSLTRDVLKDKSCQDIISSMIFLCNSLNIKVIAEYVETEEQKELLKLLGCGRYQGYLFSKALPAEKCFEYINKLKQKTTS